MTNDLVVKDALVNQRTGEVMELVTKTPEEMVQEAKEAAELLEKIISSNKQPPMTFNGKRYLEIPHWQTIGKFYHVSAATHDAGPVEIHGVQGAKAHADLIDEKTGLVVGGADGYCMKDESGKSSWSFHKLAALAQTRAVRSALANKFRYVAIVAGYEPNLPEESETDRPKVAMPQERPLPPPSDGDQQTTAPGVISEKQRKMLYARCRQAGITEELAKAYMKDNFNFETSLDMNWKQLDQMLKWIGAYSTHTPSTEQGAINQ